MASCPTEVEESATSASAKGTARAMRPGSNVTLAEHERHTWDTDGTDGYKALAYWLIIGCDPFKRLSTQWGKRLVGWFSIGNPTFASHYSTARPI